MAHVSIRLGKEWNGRRVRCRQTQAIACFIVLGSALFACGQPPDELALHRAEQPILRGTVDREHPEVMLLAHRDGFMCTGTVIHVGERSGALLTAAHCVTEEDEDGAFVAMAPGDFLVVPGTDFAESTSAHPVQAIFVEPHYEGLFAGDDIAVVRFSFGGAPAPEVIAPLTASDDTLDVGTRLELVGYGQTEVDNANTERRRVSRTIGDLDPQLIIYSQRDGRGACFGDSGGPALVQVGGETRVAAVISGAVTDVAGSCEGGDGVAMRVSAYEDFIHRVSSE
jgi:secreted trypsin-like serine protease